MGFWVYRSYWEFDVKDDVWDFRSCLKLVELVGDGDDREFGFVGGCRELFGVVGFSLV